jgi:hypothetical protein
LTRKKGEKDGGHYDDDLPSSRLSVGWWLMAGADFFWEKSTAGWLLVAGSFGEKSTAGWWLISQAKTLFLLVIR